MNEKYREETTPENTGKFLLSVYYQEFDSGVIDHVIGYYIDDNSEKTIQKEVEEMIMSGYLDDGIDGIEKSHEDYEVYFWETFQKEQQAKNN
jgi:alcohol dehydrogenase YqhD (iron-dependent ADH family)